MNPFISNPSLDDASSEVNLLNALKLKANIFSEIAEQTDNDDSDLKMALSTYHLAVELIDKMRTGYKTEGSKLFLGEKASEIYDTGNPNIFKALCRNKKR